MLRKTPLKSKTALRSKTALKAKTELKTKTPLKAKSSLKPKSDKAASVTKKKSREPNYVADMDKVFQYYIRLRDAMPGGLTRCISCGNIKTFDQMQAGHFHSRKYMMTRWNEDNVHSECIYDNCYNGDHLHEYEINLKKKIGLSRYNYLESIYKNYKKWSRFEIVMLVKHYGRECLRLSSSKHIPLSKGVLDIIKRYEKKKL